MVVVMMMSFNNFIRQTWFKQVEKERKGDGRFGQSPVDGNDHHDNNGQKIMTTNELIATNETAHHLHKQQKGNIFFVNEAKSWMKKIQIGKENLVWWWLFRISYCISYALCARKMNGWSQGECHLWRLKMCNTRSMLICSTCSKHVAHVFDQGVD